MRINLILLLHTELIHLNHRLVLLFVVLQSLLVVNLHQLSSINYSAALPGIQLGQLLEHLGLHWHMGSIVQFADLLVRLGQTVDTISKLE